jgi:hypothetical protein
MPKPVVITAVLLLLGACSTSHLTPDIASYGKTVEAIIAEDAKTPAARSLPARIAAQRRQDFAAHRVVYGFSDREACAYDRPDVAADGSAFAEACSLVPRILVGDDLRVAASEYDSGEAQAAADVVIDAGDIALLREQLSYGIREDLVAYGKALADLAGTTDPVATGVAVGKAFDAIAGLKDSLSAASSETGQPEPPSAVRQPARTLATTLVGEIAETLRYRRLKSVVEAADPFIQQASVQLAVLAFGSEGADLEAQSATMTDAIANQVPGSATSLAEAEAAYAALSSADAKAAYGRYAGIGRAHRTIREALDAPADLDRLRDANKRIFALAEAFKAVAEASDTGN